MRHSKIWAVTFFLSILSVIPALGFDWSGEPLPQYDQLFQRTNGWIGADGNFAVSLTNGLTLWLFSDTFVGQVQDGHRTSAKMINNSAAWQHGIDPADAAMKFFVRQTREGKPASLITPADHQGWFWLYDSVMVRGKLFLFLQQIEHIDGHGAFSFRQAGSWLGEVSNPFDPPTRWHVKQSQIPFGQFTADDMRCYGSSVFSTNGFVYIFGAHERKGTGKRMILARVPEDSLTDFSKWQFRTLHGWTAYADGSADLCFGIATEYSVSWLPRLQRYVLICTKDGLSDQILARTAPEPWGPWSLPTVVYQSPEPGWDRRNFCYSAKAHPMLATRPDELILTYAANSYEVGHVMDDARLYWPRFVRVTVK